MGKFYKILKIICLIIFILTFISRVFAYTDPMTFNINGVDYNVNLAYILNNYNYYYVYYITYVSNGITYNNFGVFFSNTEFTVTKGTSSLSVRGTFNVFKFADSKASTYSWAQSFALLNNYTFDVSKGNWSYLSNGNISINQSVINNGSISAYFSNGQYFNFSTNSLLANFDVKNNSGQVVFESNVNVSPYIVNSAQIPDWSFDTLDINLGDDTFNPFGDYLKINYNNNEVVLNIYSSLLDSVSSNSNTLLLSKQLLSNYIFFIEDSNITFTYQRYNTTTQQIEDLYDLGTYRVFLTTSVVNDLNNNSEQNFKNDMYNGLSDIDSSIQQGNQQNHEDMQELKDTMTDSTVESTASDLPSTNVNDISAEGINTIFQSIYNAFCTGNASNIVFPIPFTGKNITLSPYYVRDMLTNNGATWVYTLIQAFWGYLIGRYIVKDVSKKITKIKGGNIENIENDNIKEEML